MPSDAQTNSAGSSAFARSERRRKRKRSSSVRDNRGTPRRIARADNPNGSKAIGELSHRYERMQASACRHDERLATHAEREAKFKIVVAARREPDIIVEPPSMARQVTPAACSIRTAESCRLDHAVGDGMREFRAHRESGQRTGVHRDLPALHLQHRDIGDAIECRAGSSIGGCVSRTSQDGAPGHCWSVPQRGGSAGADAPLGKVRNPSNPRELSPHEGN